MSRRTLLLLGAGFEQITAMRITQELGYRVAAFDGLAAPAGAAFADEFHQVNVKDDAQLLDAARAVKPDGVWCHAAELAIPVAKVAEALNLPGIGVTVAERATDKRLRIDALSAAGIRTPDFRILAAEDSETAWIGAAHALGLPVVCKPPAMAGARGVELLHDEAQVLSYRARRGGVGAGSFVMENWIDGAQYSTESVIIAGKVAHTALADRHYDTTLSLRPFMIEDGHSMPSAAPPALRAEIDRVTEACAAAIGIRDGVVKGDLIVDGQGIVVLEMAARTSGGRFADTVVPCSSGVNILYPLIQMAMGDAPDLSYLKPRWNRGVSQRFFFPPPGKTIATAPELTLLGQHPGVIDVWFNRALLGGTVPPVTCHGDRVGYVIASGATREQADSLALDLARAHPFIFGES